VDRSFSIATQGLVAGLYQLDVLAHSVANLDTPGMLPREAILQENVGSRFMLLPSGGDPPGRGVYLGEGIHLAGTPVGNTHGILVETGRETDLFAQDDGWFVLRALDGREVVYARSLSLTRVPSPEGDRFVVGRFALLTEDGEPLVLPSGVAFRVNPEGNVIVVEGESEQVVTRLSVGRIANPDMLQSLGDGLYFAPAGSISFALPAQVHQGVREVPGDAEILVQMIPAARYLSLAARAFGAADTFSGMAADLVRR